MGPGYEARDFADLSFSPLYILPVTRTSCPSVTVPTTVK